MIAAAVATVPALLLQHDGSDTRQALGLVLGATTWLVFAVEFAVMMRVARSPRRWLVQNPLSVPIVVLTFPLLAPALKSIGVARVARVLRLLRLLRVVRAARLLRRVLTIEGLRWASVLVLMVILLGGVAFADVEGHQVDDGLWWALTTVTLLGDGQVYPRTEAGRIIGIVVLGAGVSLIGLFSAAVADRLIHVEKDAQQSESELASLRQAIERQSRQLEVLVARDRDRSGDSPARPGDT